MYKNLLELIKLIFGPKALSKTIGTRTNVIQLPNNKTKRYIKEDLNIEAASDAAAMNAKKEMEELIAEIPKMNDAERLIFEGNLRRLKNKLGIRSETDPTADVFEFGTKEKVTPGGIASLTEKAGQKSPPGTVMGNIESRLNKLRASGKELEDVAKEEGGMDFGKIMDDYAKQQERFVKMQNTGLVTSTAREILQRDIKAGKLKLPKEIEDRIMLVDGNPGTVNPVEVFRTNYGEDALEQLDSLIPELAKAQSYSDLVKIVEKKYPMKPLAKPRKETMSLDEAAKAEEENILTPGKAISADSPEGKKITEALIGKPKAKVTELLTAEKIIADMNKMDPMDAMYEANKVLKKEGKYKNLKDEDVQKIMSETEDSIFERNFPEEPEDFATGGRVGYSDGTKPSAAENTPSQAIINRMIAQIKQLSKRGVDVSTIKDIVGASDQMIKDVLGKASGGRMSKGLDYLMGIERRGYAEGTDLAIEELIQRMLIKNPNILIENPDGGDQETITPNYSNRFMGNPQAKSMYTSPYPIGFMDIFGGISNIAAKAMGYPDVGYALGALTGWGKGGPGMSYGASNRSGAVDTADTGLGDTSIAGMGYSAAYGNAEASEGAESPGGDNSNASDPGGSDTEGSFATGGLVNRTKNSQGGLNYLMGY